MAAKAERKAIDKVFILLGLAVAIVLVVVSGLTWYGYTFASDMVKANLSEQKIFFPEKDSEAIKALSEADQKEMNKYAGQQLVDGDQAKVYADNYIKAHLAKIAGGKTYSEVSAEAMKDPTNTTLQTQKTVLFQGETLRGLLLGSGYSYWTFGKIAKYVSLASFAGAICMMLLVLLGVRHLNKLK
jgi:hypothetical protein